MFVRDTLLRLFKSRRNMMKTQERIATQKRIQKPSDGPVGFSRAQRLHEATRQNEVFLKNIDEAEAWMENTSAALEQFYQHVVDARMAATHGSDALADENLRNSLAEQLRGLLEEMVSVANSSYLGKDVFGGTSTKVNKPFVKTDLDVQYVGDDKTMKRRISKNIVLDINIPGNKLMETGIFDAMKATIQALEVNDPDALMEALDQMRASEKKVLKISTVYGSKISNLQLIKDRLQTTNENFRKFISQEEDAVLEEEMINLQSEQLAYQAALQATSKIMNLSLLQYM